MTDHTLPALTLPNQASTSVSPLRYPGGKSWLAPVLAPLLRRWPPNAAETRFTEPFAGGASLSCMTLGRARHYVHINELDADVYAVWKVIFSSDAPLLAQGILSAGRTFEALQAHLQRPAEHAVDLALQTIIRNRLNYGGILKASAGVSGAQAQGTPPRWYPETLAARVLALQQHAARAHVSRADALELLERLRDHAGVVFIDPPYTATPGSAGHTLYPHAALDHAHLMHLAAQMRGPWLMTHEDHPVVAELALQHDLDVIRLHMQTNAAQMRTELAIGRGLHDLLSPLQAPDRLL